MIAAGARPSPLRNRVDPAGDLVASPSRGMLMGNRGGRFHRDDGTLGARRWASRQWIACVCDFRGRRRRVWGAGYTELFFLDEPTALAAGHRPCFECRRPDALRFQALFPGGPAPAPEMDHRLHAERLAGNEKRTGRARLGALPDGAMIRLDGRAFALRRRALLPWSFDGYGAPRSAPAGLEVETLTPPSIVAALAAGYQPRWDGDVC